MRPGLRCAIAGFTLIEMVIAMAILALLATAAVPLAQTTIQRTREAELRTALRTIRDAIDAYRDAAVAGRIARNAGDSGYPPDLETLVAGVRDLRSVRGDRIYFLRRIPRDPLASSVPDAPPRWGLRSYDSPPDDPQSGRDVFDVHSLAGGRGLNGVPYREW